MQGIGHLSMILVERTEWILRATNRANMLTRKALLIRLMPILFLVMLKHLTGLVKHGNVLSQHIQTKQQNSHEKSIGYLYSDRTFVIKKHNPCGRRHLFVFFRNQDKRHMPACSLCCQPKEIKERKKGRNGISGTGNTQGHARYYYANIMPKRKGQSGKQQIEPRIDEREARTIRNSDQ